MSQPKLQRQSDRRDDILEAAGRCFVRSGFHQTSMQEICAEAGMSAGNLYRYFPSKEAIISAIAERDRAELAQDFARADLSQGLFAVIEGMMRHHFSVRPVEEVLLCTEVMAEARHNPEIARISRSFDTDVRKWLLDMFRAAAEQGDIPKDADFERAVDMLMLIADGMWWRRALDPNVKADTMIPVFMDVARHLLRSRSQDARAAGGNSQ
ncbi:TetR/AcrR family transcriptional regulator [Rhodoplanes sp. Z2-YC6860]|uniref:TetR/AcrR family transcriptional regulator n=1 Tax=Rhodoplanes sp. Z2-YC6860 TaxID=674703 RepID=UPI00078E4CDA|nr:TetR/AcrR family transcriptional regulator [Rhodoplanes sp. Z2-YC6860]AMN43940.1 TetR family transcriptional regulator [Rhodoplanes sp. Z2-YC6860]